MTRLTYFTASDIAFSVRRATRCVFSDRPGPDGPPTEEELFIMLESCLRTLGKTRPIPELIDDNGAREAGLTVKDPALVQEQVDDIERRIAHGWRDIVALKAEREALVKDVAPIAQYTLTSVPNGPNGMPIDIKIAIIKAVRNLTNLGLHEAKMGVELCGPASTPTQTAPRPVPLDLGVHTDTQLEPLRRLGCTVTVTSIPVCQQTVLLVFMLPFAVVLDMMWGFVLLLMFCGGTFLWALGDPKPWPPEELRGSWVTLLYARRLAGLWRPSWRS